MRINNVLDWLENSAHSSPDKIVFADEHTKIDYVNFVLKAKRLGVRIAAKTPPRTPVAILGDKSVETLTAFFGCVYAGCFYVPLNPNHPAERHASILSTLGNPLVAVASDFDGKVPDNADTISICDSGEGGGQDDFSVLEKIRRDHTDVDPLYVLFTSGSTGEPKGIAVSHRSVIDFIEEFTGLFGIGASDVIGNQAPFDFDVSTKDIYSTLKTGATMQIIPKQKFSFPTVLIDYLCERGVTTLIWAVSALCILSGYRAFGYKVPAEIKKVLFSGETMPIKHLRYWQKFLPDAQFVNLYGPTEITCNCTYYAVPTEFDGDRLPIGKHFPNERVFLLGDDGKVISPDSDREGEICVTGTALSLGYYNNAAETAKAFVPCPDTPHWSQTAYRTGDVGRYDGDGNLLFVGRRDFQVKHLGHRIELSEIDAAMGKCGGVDRAVCIYDDNRKKIHACYTGEASDGQIAAFLREILPPYMIPNRFECMETLPLTENGKVNRKKLAEILGI